MRCLTIVPICLVAACSGGGEEKKAEKAASTMAAGQWEVVHEVTSFDSTDKATPALKATVGERTTTPACIDEGDAAKPKPELFAGAGYECKYKSDYIRNGRINASITCERDALEGEIMMTVQGTYKGDDFEGTVDAVSFLSGEGDFKMSSKMSGRRTAATCAPDGSEKDKGGGNKAG